MIRSCQRWGALPLLRMLRQADSFELQRYPLCTTTDLADAAYVSSARRGPEAVDPFDQSRSRGKARAYGSRGRFLGLKRFPARATWAGKPSTGPGCQAGLYGQV